MAQKPSRVSTRGSRRSKTHISTYRDHAGDRGSDGAHAGQRGGGHGHHHAALQVDIFRYIYKISTIYLQRDLHLQEPEHVCGQSGGEHGDGGHGGGAGGGPPPHHQHPPQGTAHKVGRKIFVTRKNILMKIFLVFGWKAAAATRCTAGGGGAVLRPG